MELDLIMQLSQFGFSKNEAKAYIYLLTQSPATGYEISQNSGVPRSAIYDILKKMELRGLVSTIGNKPIKYIPLSTNQLSQNLTSQFEHNISEFKKKGDEHNKIIEDVHTKYFGEDDGELVKDLSGIVKNFEESIVNEVSGDNNPNSSINKFKLAADEMEKQITESINEAFNPNSEEDQNIASIMVKTIVEKISDPIATQFRILFKHLDVENALDNTTQKGFVFEDELKIVLQNVKGPKDLVEHCGKKAGIKSRNFKGDFVVQFPDEEGLPSPAKVVFEAKNHKSITNFKDTIGYLDDAMANREANCAVWIVKDQKTISQFTDQPFYEYNNRYAFVVFNEDTGDMALRFAFSWAMLKSRELMGISSDSFNKVEANRLLSIMIKDVKQFGSLRTNNNSILSIAGENKTTINNE